MAELLACKGTYDNFPLDAEAVTAVRSVCMNTMDPSKHEGCEAHLAVCCACGHGTLTIVSLLTKALIIQRAS